MVTASGKISLTAMTWLIALAAVTAQAEARVTIVAPVVLREARVNVPAERPRTRACDADQPPQCRMMVIDLV